VAHFSKSAAEASVLEGGALGLARNLLQVQPGALFVVRRQERPFTFTSALALQDASGFGTFTRSHTALRPVPRIPPAVLPIDGRCCRSFRDQARSLISSVSRLAKLIPGRPRTSHLQPSAASLPSPTAVARRQLLPLCASHCDRCARLCRRRPPSLVLLASSRRPRRCVPCTGP
jgi:hypothetical protein